MFPGLVSLGLVAGCWIDSWEIRMSNTTGGGILGLPLTMSVPPDNKRSLRKQLKQKLRSAFSVTKSRNLDVPDAGPTSTSAAATSHSVSPAHNNSRADLVQETVIVNPPSTVQGPTGIGELIGYGWCSDQALNPRRSWIQCGNPCAYKLSTPRQYSRKSYIGDINRRRCVLDRCISPKS